MSDLIHFVHFSITQPTATQAAPEVTFDPGTEVVVSSGLLTGMRGVIVRPEPNQRWYVRLHGTPQGVFLVIRGQQLRSA